MLEKFDDFFVGNFTRLVVVKIGVAGSGNDKQFLVRSRQFRERVAAEINRVRFFAVNHQHCGTDFAAVSENRHVEERERRRNVESFVRIKRARMVAVRRFVIVVIIFDELRRVGGNGINDAARAFWRSRERVFRALGIEAFP